MGNFETVKALWSDFNTPLPYQLRKVQARQFVADETRKSVRKELGVWTSRPTSCRHVAVDSVLIPT